MLPRLPRRSLQLRDFMNETEPRTPESSELPALKQEVAELRRQAGTLLIAVVFLSITFAAYIYVQARRASNDLRAVRQQMTAAQQFNTNQVPAIAARLRQFGQTHPDYQAILTKYGLPAVTNAPQPAKP